MQDPLLFVGKALEGFSDKWNVREIILNSAEFRIIYLLSPCASSSHEPLYLALPSVGLRRGLGSSSPHAIFDCAGTPNGGTWATKGIFSDAHVAGKNINVEFEITNRDL